MTIFTGDDGVLDDIFSYQVYTYLKNHWRGAAAPADIQNGMIWSDTGDGKLRHRHGGADEEILQTTRSGNQSPHFTNLYLAEYIYHEGDLDTSIRFQTDQMTLRAGGVDFINMVEAGTDYLQLLNGKNFIGDNLNAGMTVGLTINQGANDDEILALKSSDVGHGATTLAETDTYVAFSKAHATGGGLRIRGLTDADYISPINLQAIYGGVADTTKSIAGTGALLFEIFKISGTGIGNVEADANLVAIRTRRGGATETAWILDEDGDTWQPGWVTSQGLIVGTPTELTIAGGVITVTKGYHKVDTQANAAQDDLDTINGGVDGQILIIRPEHTDRTVNVTEAGNIRLDGVNRLMNNSWKTLTLIYDSGLSKWLEFAYGDND